MAADLCERCKREIVDPTRTPIIGVQRAQALCLRAPDDGGPRAECLTLALARARGELAERTAERDAARADVRDSDARLQTATDHCAHDRAHWLTCEACTHRLIEQRDAALAREHALRGALEGTRWRGTLVDASTGACPHALRHVLICADCGKQQDVEHALTCRVRAALTATPPRGCWIALPEPDVDGSEWTVKHGDAALVVRLDAAGVWVDFMRGRTRAYRLFLPEKSEARALAAALLAAAERAT